MNDDIARMLAEGDPPAAATLEKIAAQLSASAIAVLPSNGTLWAISFGLFTGATLSIATVVHLKAIAVLSAGQIVVYDGVLLLFAALFSRATIERMIPGAKRVVPSVVLAVSALVVLGMLVTFLFADRSMDNFVSHGIPCLRLGVISALLSGFLGWRLLRRGCLVSPRETVTLYGFLTGLVGVSVLALHCPILNSLHVLVWHLGAMVIAGLAGFFLGSYAD